MNKSSSLRSLRMRLQLAMARVVDALWGPWGASLGRRTDELRHAMDWWPVEPLERRQMLSGTTTAYPEILPAPRWTHAASTELVLGPVAPSVRAAQTSVEADVEGDPLLGTWGAHILRLAEVLGWQLEESTALDGGTVLLAVKPDASSDTVMANGSLAALAASGANALSVSTMDGQTIAVAYSKGQLEVARVSADGTADPTFPAESYEKTRLAGLAGWWNYSGAQLDGGAKLVLTGRIPGMGIITARMEGQPDVEYAFALDAGGRICGVGETYVAGAAYGAFTVGLPASVPATESIEVVGPQPALGGGSYQSLLSASPSVEVTEAALVFGDEMELTATFQITDEGESDEWTVAVDWGDGSSSTPTSTTSKTFIREHSYAAAGHYLLTVQVTNEDSEDGTASMAINSGGIVPADEPSYTVEDIEGVWTLTLTDGKLALSGDVQQAADQLTLNALTVNGAGDDAHVEIHTTQHLTGPLTLTSGATATLTLGRGKVIVASGIDINEDSKLDLTNGSLIWDYPETSDGDTEIEYVREDLETAYAAGTWTGNGLTSSTAAGINNPATGIGYGRSLVVVGSSGGTFMGETVDETAIVARYLLRGDATMDLTVNFADLLRLSQNYGQSGKHWTDGDFNYDGTVNFTDQLKLSQNNGKTLDVPVYPAAPILTVSPVSGSSTQLDLTWMDRSAYEGAVRIERSSDDEGPWTEVGAVAANETSFRDSGLSPETPYYYRVVAVAGEYSSEYSNVDDAETHDPATSAPSLATPTVVSSSQVRLAWTDASSDRFTFQLQRATDSNFSNPVSFFIDPSTTTYLDGGLDSNTVYYYRVREAEGEWSNEPQALTLMAAPSGLTAVASVQNQVPVISVTWTDLTGEDGYKVWRMEEAGYERMEGAGDEWHLLTETDPNETSYSDTDVTPGVRYYYTVQAVNASGDSRCALAADGLPTSAVARGGAPASPTRLIVERTDDETVVLNWGPGDDTATGFLVQWLEDTTWQSLATLSPNVTSLSVADSQASSAEYRVIAVNEIDSSTPIVGQSAWERVDFYDFEDVFDGWDPDHVIQSLRDPNEWVLGAFTTSRPQFETLELVSSGSISAVRVSFDLYVRNLDTGDAEPLTFALFRGEEEDPLAPSCQLPGADCGTESVYRLSFSFAHTANSLELGFDGDSGEGTSWALDNVAIDVIRSPHGFVDLDIDSDSDDEPGQPWEEAIEDDAGKGGKVIAVRAPGSGSQSQRVPLTFSGTYGQAATFRLSYPASIAVWTDSTGGTLVESGDVSACGSGPRVLYVEALAVSRSLGDQRIVIEIDPDGETGFVITDAVRLTAVNDTLSSCACSCTGAGADGTMRFQESELDSSFLGRWMRRGEGTSLDAALSKLGSAGSGSGRLPRVFHGTNTLIVSGPAGSQIFDPAGESIYVARDGSKHSISVGAGVITLSDPQGNRIEFYGFTQDGDDAQGQFKQYVDANGVVTTASYDAIEGTLSLSTERGTSTEAVEYTYSSAGQVTSAVLLKDDAPVQEASYTYYGDDDPDGNEGDLKSVTITQSETEIETRYYRYHKPAAENGYARGLKFVFDGPAYRRLVAAKGDPATLTDDQIDDYASAYYLYDTQGRVIRQTSQRSGCSTMCGGLGTSTFQYKVSFAAGQGYNVWNYKRVEYLPGYDWGDLNNPQNTRIITYANFAGQTMLEVTEQVMHDGSGAKRYQFNRYDEQGRIILQASGDAVTDYAESAPDLLGLSGGFYSYLDDGNGVLRATTYYSTDTADEGDTGGVAGYVAGEYLLHGEKGPAGAIDNVSLTSDSHTGLATATTTAAHGLHEGELVIIQGAAVGDYNGIHAVVAVVSEYAFTYNPMAAITAGSSSGTVAPVGVLQSSTEYYKRTAGGQTIYPVANYTVYAGEDGDLGRTTRFEYTFVADSIQVKTRTTIQPPVIVSQNGRAEDADDTANADTTVEYYNAYGQVIFEKDAEGYINYTGYDLGTGAVLRMIRDVDTSQTSTFLPADTVPDGLSSLQGTRLHLITEIGVDDFGRTTRVGDPSGRVTHIVYKDLEDGREVWTYPGWHETETSGTYTTTGPVLITRENWAYGYSESLSIAPPLVSGNVPTGDEAISAANILSLSRSHQNTGGQTVKDERFFNLTAYASDPEDMEGSALVSGYSYNRRGWLKRIEGPDGTIQRMLYDVFGQQVSTWMGTDDAVPASTSWASSNSGGMAMVGSNTYNADGNLVESVS